MCLEVQVPSCRTCKYLVFQDVPFCFTLTSPLVCISCRPAKVVQRWHQEGGGEGEPRVAWPDGVRVRLPGEGGGHEEPCGAGRLGGEGNAPSRWVGSAICGSGE